jgi:hypothetical protein
VRYESYPANAVYQTYKLLQKVASRLTTEKINLPVFMQQSADDMTVDPQTALNFFLQNTHAQSKLLWYAEKNPAVSDPRIKTISAAVPKLKILDLSHLAYLLSEHNEIYGLHGDYRDCLQYAEDSASWQQCKYGSNNYLGETTPENLAAHVIQRLTFNPFQKEMLADLGAFIDSLGHPS